MAAAVAAMVETAEMQASTAAEAVAAMVETEAPALPPALVVEGAFSPMAETAEAPVRPAELEAAVAAAILTSTADEVETAPATSYIRK